MQPIMHHPQSMHGIPSVQSGIQAIHLYQPSPLSFHQDSSEQIQIPAQPVPAQSIGLHWTDRVDILSHDSVVTEGTFPNHVTCNINSKISNKSSLKVYFANSRSICNKINELHVLLSSHEYDILVFCETWLTESLPDSLLLNGLDYSIHRVDRKNKIGGGTCIFHRNFLKTCPVPIALPVDNIQIVCIDLVGSLTKYRLIACYTPPSLRDDCIVEFLNFFEGGHLLDCDASIIVCGDFNIPSNRKLSRFLDLMTERGFNQCVNTPTRDSNILDLVSSVWVRLLGHGPALAQINLQIASIKHYIYLSTKYRKYRKKV